MVVQLTADLLVGGSNPGRVNMAPLPPPTVDPPGFEPPTENFASAALPFDRRLCDSDEPPHCLEPSEFLFVLPLGARLRCCVGPWSWLWLRPGFWDVKMLGTRILIKTQKKNYLCTHFLACAIGVNVVGTNAWYLLHLCGGCGAHAGDLLQFFHGFTPFLLWCSTFVSHAFPSSHMQAHTNKYEENTQLQLLKQ
jgi:hypothetical protein